MSRNKPCSIRLDNLASIPRYIQRRLSTLCYVMFQAHSFDFGPFGLVLAFPLAVKGNRLRAKTTSTRQVEVCQSCIFLLHDYDSGLRICLGLSASLTAIIADRSRHGCVLNPDSMSSMFPGRDRPTPNS